MRILIRILVIGLCVLLLHGCAEVVPLKSKPSDAGYGPPPHAPAHGYRYKHQDVELVFDAGLGVYIVVGYPDYYFYDNRYYRYRDGGWAVSLLLEGPWVSITEVDLPPGLQKMKVKDKKKRNY